MPFNLKNFSTFYITISLIISFFVISQDLSAEKKSSRSLSNPLQINSQTIKRISNYLFENKVESRLFTKYLNKALKKPKTNSLYLKDYINYFSKNTNYLSNLRLDLSTLSPEIKKLIYGFDETFSGTISEVYPTRTSSENRSFQLYKVSRVKSKLVSIVISCSSGCGLNTAVVESTLNLNDEITIEGNSKLFGIISVAKKINRTSLKDPVIVATPTKTPATNINTKIHIMPLGDSITQGADKSFSYRYRLWELLKGANINFDYVGSQNTNFFQTPKFPDASYSNINEGHWGKRTDEVLAGLPEWLKLYTPDISLIHLGSNDLFQMQSNLSTISELEQIIDLLRKDNSSVKVLIAKLIPYRGSNQTLLDLNIKINELAVRKNSVTSPVIAVDQFSGFDPNTDTSDGTHPNTGGEEKMAQKWFQAIKSLNLGF